MLDVILPRNEHALDRVIRGVIGAGLIAPAFFVPDAVPAWIAAAVGGILVTTAVIGSCPIYTVLGLSTRKTTD